MLNISAQKSSPSWAGDMCCLHRGLRFSLLRLGNRVLSRLGDDGIDSAISSLNWTARCLQDWVRDGSCSVLVVVSA